MRRSGPIRRHRPSSAQALCACGSASDRASGTAVTAESSLGSSSARSGRGRWRRTCTVEILATSTDEGRPRPRRSPRTGQVSPDGRSLTVNLAPTVMFHDGSPLTVDGRELRFRPICRTRWARRSTTLKLPRRDVTSRRSRFPTDLRSFLLDSLQARSSRSRVLIAVATGPFGSSLDPKSLTELTREQSLRARVRRQSAGLVVFRVSERTRRRGRNCCAASSTCRRRRCADASSSLETATSVSVFTDQAPLSVYRRVEYAVGGVSVVGVCAAGPRRASAVDEDAVVREALNGRGVVFSSGPVWPQNYGHSVHGIRRRRRVRRAGGGGGDIGPRQRRRTARGGRARTSRVLVPPRYRERAHRRWLLKAAARPRSASDMSVEEASNGSDRRERRRTRRFEAALVDADVSGP